MCGHLCCCMKWLHMLFKHWLLHESCLCSSFICVLLWNFKYIHACLQILPLRIRCRDIMTSESQAAKCAVFTGLYLSSFPRERRSVFWVLLSRTGSCRTNFSCAPTKLPCVHSPAVADYKPKLLWMNCVADNVMLYTVTVLEFALGRVNTG